MKKFEKYITEGKKYPSQNDADGIIELSTALESVYLGGTNKVRELMEKIDKLRLKVWQNIFNDKSPWSVTMERGKRVAYWDDQKAKNLGL